MKIVKLLVLLVPGGTVILFGYAVYRIAKELHAKLQYQELTYNDFV